jgi:hypothetical protein
MEALLDPANPLHWAIVLVLLVSGVPCAWIGLRDGLLRRELRTNAGIARGRRAVVGGLVYLAFGVAGIAGGIAFLAAAR